jgi:hypothetical protein
MGESYSPIPWVSLVYNEDQGGYVIEEFLFNASCGDVRSIQNPYGRVDSNLALTEHAKDWLERRKKAQADVT